MLVVLLEEMLLGGFLIIVGLCLIVFHKTIKEHRDNWNTRVSWILQWNIGGVAFTASVILLGVLLILGGVTALSSAFVQP